MGSALTTKCTYLGNSLWGCRIFKEGKWLIEGRCEKKEHIGPTFRDLMRTLDKFTCYGNEYTHASRMRANKEGNYHLCTKIIWPNNE